MKLAVSNIGWSAEQDEAVFALMKEYGFDGLEIAPTRIFTDAPYERLSEAREWSKTIKQRHGFTVPSMQSIWFGRGEKIFGTDSERAVLIDYTKKAVDFAVAVGCGNLVFGCPRNRVFLDGAAYKTGIDFFKVIGEYALSNGVTIGMEANPSIYNTNYINDTASAFALVSDVASNGFRLNLDTGTMLYNEESVDILRGKIQLISHVHISEPWLKPIERRRLHTNLRDLLAQEGYEGFVSIEMGRTDNIDDIRAAMKYVKEIFYE